MMRDYLYEPTDIEDEMFLSEVPVEVLQESIETQFQDPLEYRKKDYVQSFISKYEICVDNMIEDDLEMLEVTRDNFIKFIHDIFERYLSVGFNEFDDMDEDEQHELLHQTYRFFIKNIKKNFVHIIINYINDYKEDISNNFERKKDVTSLNFKSEISDEYDIVVISNLGDIIDHIFDEISNSDVDTFFNLCQGDDISLELETVKKAYDNMKLTGNFIENYINMLDDDFKTEIQSKVRNKILKKYPFRKRKEVVVDDEVNNEPEVDEDSKDV